PNVEGGGGFAGVAALTSTNVWAVGDYYSTGAGRYRTLVERYADPCVSATRTVTPSAIRTATATLTPQCAQAWGIIPSPNAPDTNSNYVEGVTAISPDDIWAVGSSDLYTGGKGTLTMHWDGAEWSVVPSP